LSRPPAYVVVGAGAIGGVVGAHLERDGHPVLLVDADRDHVAAIQRDGLRIEGPVEQFAVRLPACTPESMPVQLDVVLLAVKAHHTDAALDLIEPRLAEDGFVVSLQNGINEPGMIERLGRERVVGALVNFGADVVAPGRIALGGRGALRIGEVDGSPTPRVGRLVSDIAWSEPTANVLGCLWAKEAYGAMLFATAVSDLSIADALADPHYRPLYVALAEEVLASAPVPVEPFDGFDPGDLDGSVERMVEFNRRSAKTHSGVYRDLAVRRRTTEIGALLDVVDGPVTSRLGELIHAIEDGRRVCERANLDLLAAYERLERVGRPLNAVLEVVDAPDRAADGTLHGVAVAVKDNVDMRGLVTTCASEAGARPPAERDAEIVSRIRAAGADLFCKTNLLEYAAGSVAPAYGMTRNPHDPGRTSGGSSGGSAALVAAGVCEYTIGSDTGGSVRIPAAYCGVTGLKPTYGLVPVDGVFPLSESCDHVGTLTRTAAQSAALLSVLSGRGHRLGSVTGLRVGVLTRQVDDPDLQPGVRAAVVAAIDRLRSQGLSVVDVDIPELDLADDALGAVVIREAYDVHRRVFEAEADRFGPGTRALLELGRMMDDAAYRAGLDGMARVREGFDRVLGQVDVLAGPTVAFTAPPEDPPFGAPEGALEARYTGPPNLAGVPAVSVPCGAGEDGLPVGLQLAAARDADALVLSVAAVLEPVPGTGVAA
jgi:2-dehydropantoate 2-reductase